MRAAQRLFTWWMEQTLVRMLNVIYYKNKLKLTYPVHQELEIIRRQAIHIEAVRSRDPLYLVNRYVARSVKIASSKPTLPTLFLVITALLQI